MSGGGLEGLDWVLRQVAAKGLAEAGQKVVNLEPKPKSEKPEPKK